MAATMQLMDAAYAAGWKRWRWLSEWRLEIDGALARSLRPLMAVTT